MTMETTMPDWDSFYPESPESAWQSQSGGPTFTDIFCGAGGSSIGLAESGMELKLAANHWDRAIETHARNFARAEHLCADVNNYDMRRLPTTDVLWASPICTESSPAGGKKRRKRAVVRGQEDMLEAFGPVRAGAQDRTRATFWDVIRATEVHRYKVIIVENVPEAADWELFDLWFACMERLGYRGYVTCINTAHIGGDGIPYGPQWRDRLYMMFVRTGMPSPEIEPHPVSWCDTCGAVAGTQYWIPQACTRPFRVGRYRRNPGTSYGQYWYRCPNARCGKRVEPFVSPAAAAIDWSDLGERIGDKSKPLAANTIRRIEAGLEMFADPITATVAGNTFERPGYLRAWPAYGAPLSTQQATATDAVVYPPSFGANTMPFTMPVGGSWASEAMGVGDQPMRTQLANEKGTEALVVPGSFLTVLRNHGTAIAVDGQPMPTVTTGTERGGADLYLTVPPGAFYAMNYSGSDRGKCRTVGEPLGAITANDGTSLVVPYYRNAPATSARHAPLGTVDTGDRYALVHGKVDIGDCRMRMLKPIESLAAQAFPTGNRHGYAGVYEVTGNQGEQTMQAGNAVSASVSHFLGRAAMAVLA
jgi:DNA (cytosine-5)-methyltransferase 1